VVRQPVAPVLQLQPRPVTGPIDVAPSVKQPQPVMVDTPAPMVKQPLPAIQPQPMPLPQQPKTQVITR
jgi:hypothetical protein